MCAWLAGGRRFQAEGLGVGSFFSWRGGITCEHFSIKLIFFCSEIKCVCTLAKRNCSFLATDSRACVSNSCVAEGGASGLLLLARDLEVCCPARYPSQVVAHFFPILSRFARLQPSLIMESTAFAGPRFLFAPAVD